MDDAVKGVQKYERLNLRKGGSVAFYFPVRAFLISRTDYLGAWNSRRFSFIRYTLKKKCV